MKSVNKEHGLFLSTTYTEVKVMNTNVIGNGQVQTTDVYKEKKVSGASLGKTIGDVKLSEKAQKYYQQLKQKFSNMEFILVSPDKKNEAEANAAKYASANKTVVLIDTEKIEKMAEDESYRKKYEGIISSAGNQIAQMQASISQTNANVKSYGIKINDGGTASFFAVIDKSLEAQRERIEKKAEEKREQRKADAREAEEKRAEKRKEAKAAGKESGDSSVTITASSLEELISRINDYVMLEKSDGTETEAEKRLGKNIDFSI